MYKLYLVYVTVLLSLAADVILFAQTGTQKDLIIKSHQTDSRIKVSSDSIQTAWVRQYISGYTPAFDFAYAIEVDASGNVYVTGSSYGSNQLPDFVTIKYSSSGDVLWVARYNGPADNWDIARDLAVDAAGNVYVTGETYSDSTYFDYATIKYDAAGNQLWIAKYDSPSNNDDRAVSLSVDSSGNVYVTGLSFILGTAYDYATIKYNSTGEEQWVVRFNGPGNTWDEAVGLALDPDGNVYVTGSSGRGEPFQPYDYLTVKYDISGAQLWVARYDNSYYDYATAIAVDASGNAYVTGYSFGIVPVTYYDYATVKYNSAGTQQWVARYDGGVSEDEPTAITVDLSGNVYVTGASSDPTNASTDYRTVKYSISGAEQWVRGYNGPGNGPDVAYAIALDGDGNIYVTGDSRGANGYDDFATIKYNPAGDEQWIVRYSDPADTTFDLAKAIAVDASQNVYVTGRRNRTGESLITTIKYAEILVSTEDINKKVPEEFTLEQNYPNPFNPSTKIRFSITTAEHVSLKIYNFIGEEVAEIVNKVLPIGSYTLDWNAENIPSGVYFYTLTTDSFRDTKKMILLK